MVYLVGAGPGNSGLITVRGLECIKKADVIIYDHLSNPTLLSHAKDGCRLIYAGKIAGNHHLCQDKINSTIIEYSKYGNVVRLKGGDPFIFGRGGEEADILQRNNIPYEIVPGISSCYSAGEYCGIPVTHRGVASSFHVITGHEKNGSQTVNYKALARLNSTLVFLMGLSNAKQISEQLMQNGLSENTPSAIISGGTTEKQKLITGTLKNLHRMSKQMFSPAVIIIGNTVNVKNEWFKPCGKKIVVTGTPSLNFQIKKAAGYDISEIPIIKLTEINFDKFSALDFSQFTHIVFTSKNGVDIFYKYLSKCRIDTRKLAGYKFAAVGKETAAALEKHGIYPDFIPSVQTGKSLGKLLAENCTKHDNLLIIRAENGSNDLTDELGNINFTDMYIYRTETDYSKKELLNLCISDCDYVILSSGSAAKAFAQMSEHNVKLISIGPSTTLAAQKYGLNIYAQADKHNADGIIECINKQI